MARYGARVSSAVASALVVGACVSANVDPSISGAFPADARVVRIYSEASPSEFFAVVHRSLAMAGFRMAQSDQAMGTLATEALDIGQSTMLRLSVVVSSDARGSVALIRGDWGVGAVFAAVAGVPTASNGNMGPADWGQSGRPKVAFGEMATIAGRIPHWKIEYRNH